MDLEENAIKMMGTYNPTEPLDRLIEKLEKEKEFVSAGWEMIVDNMMVSKVTTLMARTNMFNEGMRGWKGQSINQTTWEKLYIFFHQYHREQRKLVTTTGKGG